MVLVKSDSISQRFLSQGEFTSSLAFLGKRLINHLIRTVESPVQDLCSALCYKEVLVCKVSSTLGFLACKCFDGKLFHWYVVWLVAQCFFAIGLYGWRVAWLVVWLIWSHVTFQFSFQSIITNYHFSWHISAFKPRFHTRTLVDRLHANIMALVRQDLQTKVTDAFVHLNTRAPTARKETVGKNTFFIWWITFIKNSTLSIHTLYLSMNPTVSLIQPNSILLFKIKYHIYAGSFPNSKMDTDNAIYSLLWGTRWFV